MTPFLIHSRVKDIKCIAVSAFTKMFQLFQLLRRNTGNQIQCLKLNEIKRWRDTRTDIMWKTHKQKWWIEAGCPLGRWGCWTIYKTHTQTAVCTSSDRHRKHYHSPHSNLAARACARAAHIHIHTHTRKDSQPYHSFESLHVCPASTQQCTHTNTWQRSWDYDYSRIFMLMLFWQWILLHHTHTIFYELQYLVHDWSSITLL